MKPTPHPLALGVKSTNDPRYALVRDGVPPVVTHAIVMQDSGDEVLPIASLPRIDRPDVFCPYCGQPGMYVLPASTERTAHFRHGADPDCAESWLETVLHQRAKVLLSEWCRHRRLEHEPIVTEAACVECERHVLTRPLAYDAAWNDEVLEARLDTGHVADVALLHWGTPVVGLEVWASHKVDEAKAEALTVPWAEWRAAELVEHLDRAPPPQALRTPVSAGNLPPRSQSLCAACRTGAGWGSALDAIRGTLATRQPTTKLALDRQLAASLHLPPESSLLSEPGAMTSVAEHPELLLEHAVARREFDQLLRQGGVNVLGTGLLNVACGVVQVSNSWMPNGAEDLVRWIDDPWEMWWSVKESEGPETPQPGLKSLGALVKATRPPMTKTGLTAVLYLKIKESRKSGFTAHKTDYIVDQVHRWLAQCGIDGIAKSDIRDALTALMSAQSPLVAPTPGETGHVALVRDIEDARAAASALRYLQGAASNCERTWSASGLEGKQREAAENAIRCPVSVVCGGAGTGKTYTIQEILRAVPNAHWVVLAPTGKAVERLREGLGSRVREVMTVAKALRRGLGRTLCDGPFGVVIDEVGMLDLQQFSFLLQELERFVRCMEGKRRFRLLFVGDPNQLASVGAGKVLSALVQSVFVPTTALDRCHRSEATGLLRASDTILAGVLPSAGPGVSLHSPGADTAEAVVRLATALRSDQPDLQVLGTTNKLVNEINRRMQTEVNPHGERVLGNPTLRVGDPVVCLHNGRFDPLMNGSVTSIESADDDFVVLRNKWNQEVRVPQKRLEEFALGYAITVHKSQGSEWSTVVVADDGKSGMLDRNLLYTAATRARRELHIVASPARLDRAVKTSSVLIRRCVLESTLKYAA